MVRVGFGAQPRHFNRWSNPSTTSSPLMDLQTPLAPTTLDCAVAFHQWEIERLYRAYTLTPNPSPPVPAPIPSSAQEDTPALPSPPAPVLSLAKPKTRSWSSQTIRVRTSSVSEQTDPIFCPPHPAPTASLLQPAPTSNPPPPAPTFGPPQPAPTSSPPTPAPSASPPLPALTPDQHTSASPEVAAISMVTPPTVYFPTAEWEVAVEVVRFDFEDVGVSFETFEFEERNLYFVESIVPGSIVDGLLMEGDEIIAINEYSCSHPPNDPSTVLAKTTGVLTFIVVPDESAADIPPTLAASIPPTPAASIPPTPAASIPPTPAVSIPPPPAASIPPPPAVSIPPPPAVSIPPSPAASVPPPPAASISSTTVGSFWDFEDLLPFAFSATKRKNNISRLFSFR